MSKQVSPLFDAIEERARKYRDWKTVMGGAHICRLAAKHRKEIEEFRKYRALLRQTCNKKANINGALALLEHHPVEHEAMRWLCPDFAASTATRKREGLRWLEKQPYMQEFLPPKFEEVRF